jgi:hypothetical protein
VDWIHTAQYVFLNGVMEFGLLKRSRRCSFTHWDLYSEQCADLYSEQCADLYSEQCADLYSEQRADLYSETVCRSVQ